jgi:hypothetical protein
MLSKTATSLALAKGAAVSTSTLTLIQGALKLMAWSKAKTAVIAGACVLFAAGTTTVILELKARADFKKDPVACEILHRSLLQKVFPPKVDEDALRHQLVGTWAIEAKKFAANPKYNYYPNDNRRLKTWTLTNWFIITYDAQSNVVYSAGGPYELQGNFYTETIETGTGTMSNYVGTHPRFQIRVDGDKYYQRSPGDKPSLEEIGHRIHE